MKQPRRAKLALCGGVLAVAVGVVLVLRSFTTEPPAELRFIKYYEDGAAVLTLTNRGRSSVQCWGVNLTTLHRRRHFAPYFYLAPETGTQLVVYAQAPKGFAGDADLLLGLLRTSALPATASMQWVAEVPLLRWRIQELLSKVGIDIASTGFVATVTLPPRPAAPSLGPTNQATP
jgi:hypothetical protein